MRKWMIVIITLLLLAIVPIVNYAPDILSLVIIAVMVLVVGWGFLFGMLPTLFYMGGFRTARYHVAEARNVQTDSVWLAVEKMESLFHQKTLDSLFDSYREKVRVQEQTGQIISDLEEYINEDTLALRSWQGVVQQIPGTLTSLGLLGTFIGLIIGISSIGFSSVEAAISSIELLLSGIRTAFYTSIAGVILSILFNLIQRLTWNAMLRELGLFCETFHNVVLPNVEERTREQNLKDTRQILDRLDRLPKDAGLTLAASTLQSALMPANEHLMMQKIRKGMQDGEFQFQIRPICDLQSSKIVGGEAVICWNHEDVGEVSPATFLPVVTQNGYITMIHKKIWEDVCKTLRGWIDSGIRPVPIALSVVKMDILTSDVGRYIADLAQQYRVPPQYLVIEIEENAFLQCDTIALETLTLLRQSGFRVLMDHFSGDFVGLSAMGIDQADGLNMDIRAVNSQTEELSGVFEQARKLHYPLNVCGIETAEQMSILRRAGCNEGRGDYLYKRMNIGEFEYLIDRG